MERSLKERYYSCFFTGHRIIGREETKDKLYDILIEEIQKLINNNGVDTFICGAAMGFDTLAARAVIYLKEKYKHIKLKLYIPCYDHYKKWSMRDKYMWKYISSQCDEAIYITEGPYEADCMQKRNKRMADDAHYCIAYCIQRRSGTGATLVYAESLSCDINNIGERF